MHEQSCWGECQIKEAKNASDSNEFMQSNVSIPSIHHLT